METKTFEEKINKWTKREIAVPPKAQLPEFVNDLTEVVRSRQYAGIMEDVLYALHEETEYQVMANAQITALINRGNYHLGIKPSDVKPYEDALKMLVDAAGISQSQLDKIVEDKKYQRRQERLDDFGHF